MQIDDHPLLDLRAFVTTFSAPLSEQTASLTDFLRLPRPSIPADSRKGPIRDLLRAGGFKPSGRNKPASEYVQAAIPPERLGPINTAVDACNAASFASCLPISVVDADLLVGPPRVAVAPADCRYVFNASGQEIRLDGLICLFDDEGPCANAVKDSQRTKTHPGTVQTLSVIWGTRSLPDASEQALAWYRSLLERIGATTALL